MSKKAAKRASLRLIGIGLLLATITAAGAGPALAAGTALELTPEVRATLQGINERWLRWGTVLAGPDPQASTAVADELLASVRRLGMERLPDLSLGALVRAVDAGKANDFPRAHLALSAAEKLDPGRPEVALAGASVARLEKRYGAMLKSLAEAVVRLFSLSWERRLWLQNAATWAAALLLVTGGLFVAVEMAAKGGGPFADLAALFARLPPTLGYAVSFVTLFWPLLLPAGLVWLAIYWSILLWAHATWSERAVFASLWLLIGVLPLLASLEQRQASTVLSRPARALAALESHRLYGRLFADLDSLKTGLPDSPAVSHLLADFHLSLGQWEQARPLYRQVVAAEPKNTSALLALGGYSFTKGELPEALQYFEQAAVADPGDPAPLFNQVQVYYRNYKFEEAAPIRERARQLDRALYSRWEEAKQRIVLPKGGMARIPEIRRALVTADAGGKAGRGAIGDGLGSFAIALMALVLAFVVKWLRRALPSYPPASWRLRWRSLDLLRRSLLPGITAAETGRGFELFFTLLVPSALLLLPLSDRFGVRIPWGYDPGNAIAWILGIGGLAVYFLLRFLWELRNEV